MSRLVVTGLPLMGEESLRGFLLRLSDANVMGGLAAFKRLAGLPSSLASRPCDLSRLSGVTGLDTGSLEALACWPVPGCDGETAIGPAARVLAGDRNLSLGKLCPDCLADRGSVRRVWELRAIVACSEHGTLLISRCPLCSRRLGWDRPGVFRCRCNADLRQAVAPRALPELVAVARRLGDLHDRMAGDDGLDLRAAARLAWFCGSRDGARTLWRSRFLARPEPTEAAPIVAAGAEAFLDWPQGFHRWLSKVARPGEASQRAMLGDLPAAVAAAFPGGVGTSVLRQVKEWFAGCWNGPPPRWNSPFAGTGSASGLRPLAAAAREAGVQVAHARRIVAAGRVQTREVRTGSRTMSMVNPSELRSALAAENDDAIPIAGAAERLGVTGRMASRLVRLGLLRCAVDGRLRRPGFLPADAVDGLERRLAAVASQDAPAPDATTLAAMSAARGVAIAELLRRALDGSFPIWWQAGSGALLSRVRLRAADVLRGGEGGRTLAAREAAAALGVNARMVPVLVNAGCLVRPNAPPRRGGPPLARVCAASVEQFRSRFAFTRDVSARLVTSDRAALGALVQAGFCPVVASDPPRGISAVWRASDVDALLRGRRC